MDPRKVMDGKLHIMKNGQWTKEDELNVTEKEFISTPIARRLQ